MSVFPALKCPCMHVYNYVYRPHAYALHFKRRPVEVGYNYVRL